MTVGAINEIRIKRAHLTAFSAKSVRRVHINIMHTVCIEVVVKLGPAAAWTCVPPRSYLPQSLLSELVSSRQTRSPGRRGE